MIATVIGSTISICAMYAAHTHKPKVVRKISDIFKNTNYQANKLEPKYLRSRSAVGYKDYIFAVPSGLMVDEKHALIISKVLRKPVDVLFDVVLIVRVFVSQLPTRIDYDWEPSKGWTMPVGIAREGVVMHDFDKIPHMTVAGTTRFGKSVLLKLILSHLVNSQPDNADIYVIDLKGRLEFGEYDKLKQVKSVAGNVYEAKASLENVLKNVQSDMEHFGKHGIKNVVESNIKTRKFIIVDEAAQLDPPAHLSREEKKPYRYCQSALAEIARISGALGYRLILATQYPTSDNLPREIKQNADAKISFRLQTEVASRVAIDEGGAEKLVGAGRAIYRTHERREIQVPYVSDDDIRINLAEHFTEERTENPRAHKITEESKSTGGSIVDIGGFNLRDESPD